MPCQHLGLLCSERTSIAEDPMGVPKSLQERKSMMQNADRCNPPLAEDEQHKHIQLRAIILALPWRGVLMNPRLTFGLRV